MNLIEGTTIPEDPRKRGKNHGRLVITLFLDANPEILRKNGFNDITDAVRAGIDEISKEDLEEFMQALDDMFGYDLVQKIQFMVGR